MNFKSFWIILFLFLLLASCSENKIIAFQNVNLVPMNEEKIVKNQTVLIRGKKIIQIGPSNNIEAPRNSKIINGEGAFLMPGLTDMHMHTRDDWLSPIWPVSPLNLYIANGVTTIRCFGPSGSSPDYILHWRDEINNGKRSGPNIYTCGSILYGPVKDPEGVVQEQKNKGFDFIKIYSFVSQDEFHKAIQKAKRVGIYTAGHIPFSVGLDGVLSEGMDEIAHIEELDFEFLDFDSSKKLDRIELFRFIIDTAIQQHKMLIGLDIEDLEDRFGKTISATIDKLRTVNIPICTTLVVGKGIVKKLYEPEAFLKRSESKYLPEGYMNAFRQGKEKHQMIFNGFEDFSIFKYTLERLLLMKLKEAGIMLLLSTDAGTGGMGIVPGFSIHDELQILAENGFTPYEAITTGTVNAAKTIEKMTGEGDFGTVEVGNRADLILVNKNPLEDVKNVRDFRGVMVSGRWYDKTELQKMINIPD
ncbi:MAG: amidohydrolase family protein [Deltaproteobacteria bacterium]|nr:amidohydrolase family protein [Deltaproteobacteria bacterium]